jgi:hypothetical protein
VFPYDPTRNDSRWLDFNRRFEDKYQEKPDQFASLAFDAMNALIDSICKAGLNRARIHDALAGIEQYNGVTGRMIFDPNQKNVAPMYLGTVRNGEITYRVASMEKEPAPSQSESHAPTQSDSPLPQSRSTVPQEPYARIGEDGITYAGPHPADLAPGAVHVVLFGPQALSVARMPEVMTALGGRDAPSWTLTSINSDQNWGAASTQLVHALIDDHALAIITLDRNAAHLAEQLALKALVPVIALSDDKSLTANNVPWIFRIPAATTPASAMRLLRTAERQSGPNPERLRNVLASGNSLNGIAFLPTGEPAIN